MSTSMSTRLREFRSADPLRGYCGDHQARVLRQGKPRTAKKQLDEIIGSGSPYEKEARNALDEL